MKPEELLAQRDFVRRLAGSLIRDESTAEDITQQACLAAMARPPGRLGSPRVWLRKVVRGLTVDFFRREERRGRREKAVARPEGVPSSEEIAQREEIRRKVVEAVDKLEEPYGSAVILRYYEDLSVEEIARRLHVSNEAVKKRIQRGLAKLRARLDAEFHGNRDSWCLALAPIAGIKLAQVSTAAVSASAVSTTVPSIISGTLAMSAKVKIGLTAAILIGPAVLLFCLMNEDSGESGKQYEDSAVVENAAQIANDADQHLRIKDGEDPSRDRILVELTVVEYLIIGKVLSREDDTPVQGAVVTANKLPYQEDLKPFKVSTDDKGFFSATCSVPVESDVSAFQLHFTCEGYRSFKTVFPLLDSKKVLNCGCFYLDVNRTFDIQIIDGGSDPVSGARLRIFKDRSRSIFLERFSDRQGFVSFTADEINLDRTGWRHLALAVRAPGYSDYVYICSLGGRRVYSVNFPDEIILMPHSIWSGWVVDSETGHGIPGAMVHYDTLLWGLGDLLPESQTTTDASGYFELPIIDFECELYGDNRCFETSVRAECYNSFSSLPHKDPYPGFIALRKHSGWITGLAVVDSTDEPLVNTKIESPLGDRMTDENGCFNLLARHVDDFRFIATIPDRKLHFYGKLDRDSMKSSCVIVPFKPTIQMKFTSLVVDELDCPVSNASCRLVSRISDAIKTKNDRATDVKGMAIHELYWVDEPKSTYMEIYHPDFCRFISEEFELGGNNCIELEKNDKPMKFVLRRGLVFRNIKVMDSSGQGKGNVGISAEIDTCNGETVRLFASSDRRGLCVMTFPFFDQGKIYVDKRPDITIELDYTRIMRGEWINLVVHEEMNPDSILEGIVVDERGVPIESVRVRPSVAEGKRYTIASRITTESGKFRIPVLKDRLYNLIFYRDMEKGVKYKVQKEKGLKAGSYLTVTMRESRGVEVTLISSLSWNEMQDLSKIGFKVWLEMEDGSAVDAGEIIYDLFGIIFLDIPDGKLRAVIRDSEGKLYRSEFFQVKEGKCEQEPVINMNE